MGYNTQLLRTEMLPTMEHGYGNTIVHAIIPKADERVTIPYMRFRTGVNGGNLFLAQPEIVQHIRIAAPVNTISIREGYFSIFDRYAVIVYDDESVQTIKITAYANGVLTLAENLKVSEKAHIYIMKSSVSYFLPGDSAPVLEAPCPGVFAANEKGWPVLFFASSSGSALVMETAIVAYINS